MVIFHGKMLVYQRVLYLLIPINTIFNGMNINLPAILGFTRGTRVLTHPHMNETRWSTTFLSRVLHSRTAGIPPKKTSVGCHGSMIPRPGKLFQILRTGQIHHGLMGKSTNFQWPFFIANNSYFDITRCMFFWTGPFGVVRIPCW